ncbi:MAG: LacI family DNA-binding transcriptional regulator [Chitinophagaceae bacterium]
MFTKTTIIDIARELNINPGTVSRALNNHPAISESTKNAVRIVAGKLNYRQNKIASSLRLGRSNIIGVIIPSAEINFFGSVVHGIEKIANERGYNILIYQSNEESEQEIKGVETFLRARVDGIMGSIAKSTTQYDHFLEIKKRGTPLVLFDRADDELGVPSVVVDDYKGAYKATEHLVQQGCRRIAHIGGQSHIKIFKDRLRGYKDALKANGLRVIPELIVYGNVTIESGKTCMEQLLNTPVKPDGVFAVEDFTALGAMQLLKEKHIKIPQEIAIIGFANEAFSEYITPSLSTVDQQTVKMGESAAHLFFELLRTDSFYKIVPPKTVLEPVLIFRDSSLRSK